MSNNNKKKNPKKSNYYYDDEDDNIDIWDTYFTKSKKAGNSVMARLADPLLYHWEQRQRYEYHIQRKQQEGTNRQSKAKQYSLTKDRIKQLDSIGFLWGSGPKDNKSSTTTTTKKKQPTNNNKKESSTGNKAKNNKTGSTTTTNHEKGTKQLLTTTSKPPKTNNNKTNDSSANMSAHPVSSNNNKSKEVAAVKKKKSTTNTNKKSSSALPVASRSKKKFSTSTTTYVKNKSFQDRIKALKAFKKKHGHLNINRSLADKSLYDWSRDQRCFYRVMLRENKKTVRSLTQERVRELNQIGFFDGVTCDKQSKMTK